MSRRGRDEGSLYRRADGRWVGRLRQADGRYKSFYGATRQEVSSRLNEAIKARSDGLTLPGDREKVGTYLQQWSEGARTSVRAGTWKRYDEYIRLHAAPAIGSLQMTKLTPLHLQRLYAQKIADGLSPTTVHHLHACLHKAFDQAVRWGLLVRNPADLVDPPRIVRKEMRALSVEEARRLLEVAADDRYVALYHLAITAGMRQGELLGLRWRDVDLRRGTVRVVATLQRVGGTRQLMEPKTTRSRREVALGSSTRDRLDEHRRRQAQERLAAGALWKDQDLVFANHQGGFLDASELRKDFQRLLRKARLPKIRFHDLRHTAATLMLSQGVHPKIASEILGHSTVQITLDLYSHVSSEMQRDAMATVDRVLGG